MLAAEAEASRRALDEAARQLREDEAATNAELQRIANAGRRAQAEAETSAARVENKAGGQAGKLRTVRATLPDTTAPALIESCSKLTCSANARPCAHADGRVEGGHRGDG